MSKSNSIHCNISNDKISSSEWDQINKRMLNNEFSKACFMCEGEIAQEIIQKDAAFLASVGITTEQIADRLQSIIDQDNYITYLKHPKRYQKIGDYDTRCLVENFYVYSCGYMGAQTCPFQNKGLDDAYHGYSYGSYDFFIFREEPSCRPHLDSYRAADIKADLWFNTLLIHMIRDHGFFEGPHQTHRLEPSKVIDVLGIQPGINYKLPRESLWYWSSSSSSSTIDSVDKARVKLNAAFEGSLLNVDNTKANGIVCLVPQTIYDLCKYYKNDQDSGKELMNTDMEQRYEMYIHYDIEKMNGYIKKGLCDERHKKQYKPFSQVLKEIAIINNVLNKTLPISELVNNAALVIFNYESSDYSDYSKAKYTFLDIGLTSVYHGMTSMTLKEYSHVILSD
jgi:hypothetical protein